MTGRRRVHWPLPVCEGLLASLSEEHASAREAKTRFKVRVYLAVEQGLTTQDVAATLGISQASASRYRIQGEAVYRERAVEG